MTEPPVFPSINLPSQILPNPPVLPRPILEIPRAEAPSYIPMIAPPDQLSPPVGVPREGEEEVTEEEKTQTKQENPLPEVRRVNIPWTDIEIPVPKEEIVATAATTAAVSVEATLTATTLINN